MDEKDERAVTISETIDITNEQARSEPDAEEDGVRVVLYPFRVQAQSQKEAEEYIEGLLADISQKALAFDRLTALREQQARAEEELMGMPSPKFGQIFVGEA